MLLPLPGGRQRALQRATGLSHDRLRTTYHWLRTATQGAENTQGGGGAKNTHPALAGARPFLFSPRSDSNSENREVGMQHAREERIARARKPPRLLPPRRVTLTLWFSV